MLVGTRCLCIFYFIFYLSDSDEGQWQKVRKTDIMSGVIQGHNNKDLLCLDAVFSLTSHQPAGHSFSEPFQITLIHFSNSIPPWKPEEEENPNVW